MTDRKSLVVSGHSVSNFAEVEVLLREKGLLGLEH